jgi:hypothetical protein
MLAESLPGIPGIGEEIEGATQHAPQPRRQFTPERYGAKRSICQPPNCR